MVIDSLIEKIIEKQNPTCVGLDTAPEYLPELSSSRSLWTQNIFEFNERIIESIYDIVPAVKVQVAYYEALGVKGMECFEKTCAYAKKHGLFVIADCKRSDIGATAEQYAKAYFEAEEGRFGRYIDLLTVNGYLGSDGVLPFVEKAKENDKGIFVLVKTSNPSSGELQNLKLADGRTVYECMGDTVEVGRRHPRQIRLLPRGRRRRGDLPRGSENSAQAHAALLLSHPGLRRAGRQCRNAQTLLPKRRHGGHREQLPRHLMRLSKVGQVAVL